MLLSQPIPALYGGVSQQPAAMRSPLQLEEMVNSWATVVDGIGKRPPTEYVAQISTERLDGAFLHPINRDSDNRFEVVIGDRSLSVHDLSGREVTLTLPYGVDYLSVPEGLKASDVFAAVTVADYTLILNKTRAPDLLPLNGDRISGTFSYYNVNRAPSAGGAENFEYPANPAIGPYMGVVQTFQDLPETPTNRGIYKIQATAETGFTGYYVQRLEGTWIEVTRPGAVNGINAENMPWALVRKADGSFDFAPFSWAPRRVGDESTNPVPTFIGRPIQDIFFVDNRLGFLVDENAIMSRAGDFGNFWRMSSLDMLDDDLVDIAATETKVTKFKHAVPMSGGLMLFSDQVQFRLDKGDYLTPTSGSLNVTTQYPVATAVKPEPVGSDVYFASENGGWVRLWEYFVEDGSDQHDATDVTGHVPRLIPKGIHSIAGSAEHDAVLIATSGAPNRIYHYRFMWNGEEKAQSCWGIWEFGANERVLSVDFVGEYAYVVLTRDAGTFIERINLSSSAVAPTLDHPVYLDGLMHLKGTYNAERDRTSFDLPYAVPVAMRDRVRLVRDGGWPAGRAGLMETTAYGWYDDMTLTYPGDVSASGMLFGFAYGQRWAFSRWYMKNSQGMPDLTGRLQVRTVTLNYHKAAFFQTEVAPYGVNPSTETIIPTKLAEFTGKVIGNTELVLGDPSFDSGSYSFQVYGNAEDALVAITNDSHLGAWFTSAEVEFFWQKRSKFQ